jgi:hypothetical protein
LGQELTNPKFLLSAVALLASDKTEKAVVSSFFEEFHPTFYCGEREWQSFSDLNAIRFLTYDEASALPESFLTDTANTRHRGFGYAVKRGSKAHVYFLAGRDADAIINVIQQLVSMESVAAEGFLFSID